MGVNQDKRSEAEASEQRQLAHYLSVCTECGSLNVQVTAWVFANRIELLDHLVLGSERFFSFAEEGYKVMP